MLSKLYVGNLPFKTKEEDLTTLLQQAGTVESVRIITEPYSGHSRGFGFVEMGTTQEAAKAIGMFNGYSLGKRGLIVNEAREWQEHGGRQEDFIGFGF
ncbi:MAG: RNA-binding protein [Thermodesulfobacteriota bacterium]